MLELKVIPMGMLQTNAFLLHDDKEAILIDAPDSSYGKILKKLDELSLELKALLLTHGHWDHVFDAYKFQKAGIPLYTHKDSAPYLEDPLAMTTFPVSGLEFEAAHIDHEIKDKQILELLGTEILCHDVPGHCPGSIAYEIKSMDICITGDLIFFEGVGRTDFPGGSSQMLTRSIKQKIFRMPDKTTLYPGHGPKTSVGHEKKHNPYLTGW